MFINPCTCQFAEMLCSFISAAGHKVFRCYQWSLSLPLWQPEISFLFHSWAKTISFGPWERSFPKSYPIGMFVKVVKWICARTPIKPSWIWIWTWIWEFKFPLMCLQKWLNARGNVDWAIWKIHSPALPCIWSTFLNPKYIQRYNILDMSGQLP